jgi:hypothetical protein
MVLMPLIFLIPAIPSAPSEKAGSIQISVQYAAALSRIPGHPDHSFWCSLYIELGTWTSCWLDS